MSETNNDKNSKDEFEEVIEELENSQKATTKDPKEADLIDEGMFDDLIPNMAINEQNEAAKNEPCIVEDEALLGVYDEILNNCRKDRQDIDEVLANFIDMVFNEGDATSATKEGIVNLMKTKSDISDKMSKIADLMTRVKLKSKDTFPKYLAAHQHNNFNVSSNRRELIKRINSKDKKGKDD